MKGKGKGECSLSRKNNGVQEHEMKYRCFKSLPTPENLHTESSVFAQVCALVQTSQGRCQNCFLHLEC